MFFPLPRLIVVGFAQDFGPIFFFFSCGREKIPPSLPPPFPSFLGGVGVGPPSFSPPCDKGGPPPLPPPSRCIRVFRNQEWLQLSNLFFPPLLERAQISSGPLFFLVPSFFPCPANGKTRNIPVRFPFFLFFLSLCVSRPLF